MYQLSGGAPFTVLGDGTKQLKDRSGEIVELMGCSGHILQDITHDQYWSGCKIAWVSRCDEPAWADECLRKFRSGPNHIKPLIELAHSSHIYPSNKKVHFKNISNEFPEIAYSEMIFFDNEMINIRHVSELGVCCVHCPNGMTKEIWQQGLEMYNMNNK